MAQDIAGEMTAPPTGGIWRAWWDAFRRPRYTTFARWYPRMQTRWRLISLAVSLALIVITSFVLAGFFIAPSNDAQPPFTFMRYLSYLTSPDGSYQILAYVMASVTILFALPLTVALYANRQIGPFRVRFRVAFGTWMQMQPAICVCLLFGICISFVFGQLDLARTWISFIWLFVAAPFWATLTYTCEALSAGSGRQQYRIGCLAAVVAVAVFSVVWFLVPAILGRIGHPVF